MLNINIDRLWNTIMELGRIGNVGKTGVTRIALSPEDIKAKETVAKKMKVAGLEVKIDPALNLIGKRVSQNPDAKTLIIGSHLDTVPQGGMFDGALGVLAGLEIATVLNENNIQLPFNLEIIGFNDEERGTVGSRAMAGKLLRDEIFNSPPNGTPSLAKQFKSLGHDPEQILSAQRDLSQLLGVLELHIEQGPRLESEGICVGVVTSIAGIDRYQVTVKGFPGHAGTTPMEERQDALVKASNFIQKLPEWAWAVNPEMVATIGRIELEPNAFNVIPGKCRFFIEMRSRNPGDLKALNQCIESYMIGHSEFAKEKIYDKSPVPMDESFVEMIGGAAENIGVSRIKMTSGAGHDVQVFAHSVPTGMIFIPCKSGISHNINEWAEKKDVKHGTRVLLETLFLLAERTGL